MKIIPLHAGDDDDEDSNRLRVVNYAAGSEIRSLPSIPLYSLDIESGAKVYTLDLNNYADSRPARSMSQLREATRTPSPSSKYNFFRRNSESAKGCRAKSGMPRNCGEKIISSYHGATIFSPYSRIFRLNELNSG